MNQQNQNNNLNNNKPQGGSDWNKQSGASKPMDAQADKGVKASASAPASSSEHAIGSLKDGLNKEAGAKDSESEGRETTQKAGAKAVAPKGGKQGKGAGKEVAGKEDSEGSEDKGLSLASLSNLSLDVNKAVEFSKTYLAKDKTAPFLGKLGSEVGEQVIDYVQDWAGKNNARLDVKVTGVQSQTGIYTGVGAAAGAGLGFAFGGKVGAALGLIFGAALGAGASCVTVGFKMDEDQASDAQVVH